LRDKSVGKPGADGAPKTVSLGSNESARQHSDHTTCGEPPEFTRQISDRLTLDAACLPCCRRAGSKRQPQPPGTGPSLMPANHSIKCADGSAGNERHIFYAFVRRALRIGSSAAQPCRYRRSGRRDAGRRSVAS
jgi:hypothetical protein